MAPDIRNGVIKTESDVYSFGVLSIQVDLQCFPAELSTEVEKCKSIVSGSHIIGLARECLHNYNTPTQRLEMDSICQKLSTFKNKDEYTKSLTKWRNCCLEQNDHELKQDLFHLEKENDKLQRENRNHELFEEKLLSIIEASGIQLDTHILSEDQPDSSNNEYDIQIHVSSYLFIVHE